MSELIETFCVLDRQPIPPERAVRRSNTCSTECARRLIAIRKVQRDQRYCRHCGKPSTPEQRLDFLAWRKAQPGWAGKRGRPPKARPICAEHLRDLLGLVNCQVPLATIEAWSKEQRAEAEKWAAKQYLRASDNPVRVPPRPAFLDGYECCHAPAMPPHPGAAGTKADAPSE